MATLDDLKQAVDNLLGLAAGTACCNLIRTPAKEPMRRTCSRFAPKLSGMPVEPQL